MLIKEEQDAHITKASCHCGRKTCSRARAKVRRQARHTGNRNWKNFERKAEAA